MTYLSEVDILRGELAKAEMVHNEQWCTIDTLKGKIEQLEAALRDVLGMALLQVHYNKIVEECEQALAAQERTEGRCSAHNWREPCARCEQEKLNDT